MRPSPKPHVKEKWAETAHVRCALAPWASPYTGVPGIVVQPIGLRLTLSDQNCTALFPSVALLTKRKASFWPIRTTLFGPIKMQGFGDFICLRTDQSGSRHWGFCLCKSVPPGLHEPIFSFHHRMCFLGWSWNTEDVLLAHSGAV